MFISSKLETCDIFPSIPKPVSQLLLMHAWEVDDATEEDESNTCYIVMEFIPGKLVIDIWDKLEEKARQNIHAQLYGYICQLQVLEIKISGPIEGGISEGALFKGYGARPFHSPKELEDWYNDSCTCISRPRACQSFTAWSIFGDVSDTDYVPFRSQSAQCDF